MLFGILSRKAMRAVGAFISRLRTPPYQWREIPNEAICDKPTRDEGSPMTPTWRHHCHLQGAISVSLSLVTPRYVVQFGGRQHGDGWFEGDMVIGHGGIWKSNVTSGNV